MLLPSPSAGNKKRMRENKDTDVQQKKKTKEGKEVEHTVKDSDMCSFERENKDNDVKRKKKAKESEKTLKDNDKGNIEMENRENVVKRKKKAKDGKEIAKTVKDSDKGSIETENKSNDVKGKKKSKDGKEVGNAVVDSDMCSIERKNKDNDLKRKKKAKDRKEVEKTVRDSVKGSIGTDNKGNDVKGKKKSKHGKEVEKNVKDSDKGITEKVEKKKRKSMTKKDKLVLSEDEGFVESEGNVCLDINKTQSEAENENLSKRMKTKAVKNGSESLKSKGKPKRVSFSGQIEVFPSSDNTNAGQENDEGEDLVRGKRFSVEEDEIVKEAVLSYIETHGLGEEGLKKILNCRSHPEVKNCWKEIGAALPYRPYTAIYYRAHILFERDEKHEWTKEDYELIRKFHEKHGSNWKILADDIGKHRIHVKDTWRRIKLPNLKKGNWSQEEYQTLFDLVNIDLRLKASEEKKFKHGMLRDNICWGAISDKLSTRLNSSCCVKWYKQLTSPMVAEGIWADSDDYRMLDALFNLDACCIEDVDWDNLLDHRSGDVCRKRWDQMVHHIGQHGNKSFSEQVEILAKRYRPDLLEAKEAWENKPLVP